LRRGGNRPIRSDTHLETVCENERAATAVGIGGGVLGGAVGIVGGLDPHVAAVVAGLVGGAMFAGVELAGVLGVDVRLPTRASLPSLGSDR